MDLFSSCGSCEVGRVEVQARCPAGALCGLRLRTCYGPQFVRFAGVPYAKPPLGPLRFLPPVPLAHWNGTLDATTVPDMCWHYEMHDDSVKGTEDCLYVDIYKPAFENVDPIPVMVWIGGWIFAFNSHKLCGCGWFTEQNVIVVQVSYRLGVFGFLSIREVTAPGNCGLKDIVAALRWVRNNISAFGGDPDNVTLFGSGSGASLVHYMMLSPQAKGLFHKAIIQSGSALHPWACSYHPIETAAKLMRELNIDTNDMVEGVEQLRKLSSQKIMNAFAEIQKEGNKKHILHVQFAPCVELEFEGQQPFLTKHPFFLLKTGKFNKVPLMIGNNRHEGKFHLFIIRETLAEIFGNVNANLSTVVPQEFGLEGDSMHSKSLGRRLLQFYLRDEEKLTERNSEEFFNFLTDYYYTHAINRSVRTHAKGMPQHPTYYYILDATCDWCMPERFHFFSTAPSNGIELLFLFQCFCCVKYGGGGESAKIRRKMLRLWTNFAKYGNPTPLEHDELLQVRWQPATDPERLHYLSIGADLTVGCNPFHERMTFWDAVLEETTATRADAFFDSKRVSDEGKSNWIVKRGVSGPEVS